MAPRILIVEDEESLTLLLRYNLEAEGYSVDAVARGDEAETRLRERIPDLVLLDWMLPGISGIELCRRLRARPETRSLPIVMLTARGEEADRIVGLELGADDYVSKPFSPRELTARIKAVLRRAGGSVATAGEQPTTLKAGGLEVDTVAHEARRDGELVSLTSREFDLLVHLMRHPRRAFRREQLLEQVWGFAYGDTSTVTVHVRRLREKIEADPADPRHVRTVWGVGYRFEP